MKEAWEIFSSLVERDSRIYVELGDDAKYAVKGEGSILFHLESGGSFDVEDVLYVLGLKKNFILVSVVEDMGFLITFQRVKVLIYPEKYSSETLVVIGVRGDKFYRMIGNPI
jgi:hypothetical protein